MNSRLVLALFLTVCSVYAGNNVKDSGASFYRPVRLDQRCGPYFNWASCSEGECCSRYGWCGSSDDHCNWCDSDVADQDRDYESPEPENKNWKPADFPTDTTYSETSYGPADPYVSTSNPSRDPSSYVAPSDDSYVAPSDDSYVAPSDDSYVAPSDDSYVAPSDDSPTYDSYVEPSDSYVAPSDSYVAETDVGASTSYTSEDVPSMPDTYNDSYVSNATNYTAPIESLYNNTDATNMTSAIDYSNATNDAINYYPADREDDYTSASQMPTLSLLVIALAVFLI